ncbi:RNA methyltransferase [Clostridium sartagoforme]|uniref:RNA methyltransferase n=1 Tax=Clostridium sartagoforme TaxID=84031 RepID=A0A4V3RLN3_9CLOT|nr:MULTISPECIES: RNA methyltransferase [Clostridium]MBS5938889.1 RNA methyltransferase [Clostridium sp.]TGY44400.1 RNA methyltransferase [Clostridium sartagoforme]
MIYIESKDNNLFKYVKKLKERRFRDKEGLFILEGLRLVKEAIKANMEIKNIFISKSYEDKLVSEFNSTLLDNTIILNDNLFSQLASTENPQGVIAVVNKINNNKDEIGDFYLICDKVQDPGNLGTIIRTAHAAGVNGIILTKGTVDIYNDKTIRSTMGSIFYIPIIYEDNDFTFIKKLKSEGFSLITTSLQESKNFFEENLRGKVILAVGNEGNGISDELFDLADKKVKIPMPGDAESLNVAIAASIILFEKVRQGSCGEMNN